jgi:uncharacterized lipoprotein YehR (DUF1307 family)
MKLNFSKLYSLVIAVSVLFIITGCAEKSIQTRRYTPSGELHAANFGGIKKLCIDSVMYISSYNGMTPAIDCKTLQYINCTNDEYGRVVALPHK